MIAAQNLSVLETVYKNLYIFTLIFLAIMLILCLIRSIKGPKIADRIVAVNMMGTMVMVIIVVLSLLLKESYLVDICIIYAMISFLAVVVLTKVYMGIYRERKIQEEKEKGEKASYFDLLRCIESRSCHVVIVFTIDIPGSFFFQLLGCLLLAGS